ncbi:hypothetical protein MLP_53360 [Microlunatus phosphovorus NM-1]|uniref:Uncharacterized protein n=1 Tax=Microlunatus phosphovorus (strain ATCC 700054 / DSM 10555 / JCM 9379 / NBRC 101784 / NCIMB 13414 / VKM Ac-1990 / NM-1) TaxID=1032480 RepID=F5XIW2_MICPN|nr:hypothetical protein [Microlunatus phosphovorus]BAK38350.1 hypothetical protein MLP_53360 [Microlunatus phosphovorus NM-1]
MEASAEPETTGTVERRLPRPVKWLLWLLGALLGSVVLGFLAGLARPREPDPWSALPPQSPEPSASGPTASSEPLEPRAPSAVAEDR